MKTKEEWKKYRAEWFQRNKERVKEQRAANAKVWFQKNKKAIYKKRKEYLKQWREKNRDKWNGYSAEWYANNKERHLATGREWNKRNPGKRRKITARHKQNNREEIEELQRDRLLRYKTLVVEGYGGGCSCCGEKRIRFLTVEHLKRNGKDHRKVKGNFYHHLVRNNFPDKEILTILCMNCNWAERNGLPCPHKTEKPPSDSTSAEPGKVS